MLRLFDDFLLHFIRSSECFRLFFVIFHIGKQRILPKLLLNHFQLFPQNVFLLILVDPLFYFLLQLIADLNDLCLIRNHGAQCVIAVRKIFRVENPLPLLIKERKMRTRFCNQRFHIRNRHQLLHHIFTEFLVDLSVASQQVLQCPHHGSLCQLVKLCFFFL